MVMGGVGAPPLVLNCQNPYTNQGAQDVIAWNWLPDGAYTSIYKKGPGTTLLGKHRQETNVF